MGLESVELVMALEEEFSIQVPDSDAVELGTPGEMLNYTIRVLRLRGEDPDEQVIWMKLKAMIVDMLGVKPEEVTKSARFIEDLRVD